MMYEISQRFFFDAAHTLDREIDREGSARIHGHTYQAEVTVTGEMNPETGMVMDIGLLRLELDKVRSLLDHQLLDDVRTLGIPTLENLCAFIAKSLDVKPARVMKIRVWRVSVGDGCVMTLD